MRFSGRTRYMPGRFSWSAGGQGPGQGEPVAWTAASTRVLSAADAASVRAAGFEPAGQVMGAVVLDFAPWLDVSGKRVSFHGKGRKGYYTPSGTRDRLRYTGSLPDGDLYDGDLYADALFAGRKTSVARMTAECAAMDGDGVVAVRVSLSSFPWDRRAVAFTASGIAVRARGSVRAPVPFTAHLSGPDFARLILNGWVPAGIAIGVGEVWRGAAETEESPARRMREIAPWSDALTAAREDARRRMLDDARLIGGDGLVLSAAETSAHLDKAAGGVRCIAEATFTGTVIAAFGMRGKGLPAVMQILRLHDHLHEGENGGAWG
jgi:uncharacterized protein YbjQ (UPF0145 family)